MAESATSSLRIVDIRNPFPQARCFHIESTESTMLLAAALARDAAPEGTIVSADFQTAGRGRGQNRHWESARGLDLLFTIVFDLNEQNLPAFPIKAGLALRRAILTAEPVLVAEALQLKWPNDLILQGRKLAGLLCESKAGRILAGIGVNCNRQEFPPELASTATSIAIATGRPIDRWALLSAFLQTIKRDLENGAWQKSGWREEATACLWKRDQRVTFVEGPADSGLTVEGTISGITEEGALTIHLIDGSMRVFYAGELRFVRAQDQVGLGSRL